MFRLDEDLAVELAAQDTSRPFDHGAVSRFNAWFFTAFAGYINHVAGYHKRAAFSGLQRGATVLEIGAGTGANLGHLPADVRLYALEPSLAMHERLRRRCTAAGVDVTVLPVGAEKIPLADASVDDVICSLVLCTAPDPAAVLAEVRRVLKPGGSFRFVEHVAAPRRGIRKSVQLMIRRSWGWIFEGCDPHRDTTVSIEAAGFRQVRLERRLLRHSVFWPVNTAVWGVARR